MILTLSLYPAMAFTCAGADAEACADGAEAADLINSVMGAGTIVGSGGGVPFRRKTLFLQKKFAGIHNAAAANGCTIDDVVGGTYSAGDGSWSAERAASTQHGSFGGAGTVSGSDTNGADLGLTTGLFFDGDVFMDVHGSSTTFQAGVYRRVAGNVGYVAMLTGTCHGHDAALAMDGWFNGDLVGAPMETFTPSNVPAHRIDDSGANVTVSGILGIDTTTCDGAGLQVDSTSGGEVCVFSVGSLQVPAGSSVVVFGSRPLVVLAASTLNVESGATIFAGGRGSIPGPGAGSASARDGGTGVTDGFNLGGGGGGSGCGVGAPGGTSGSSTGGAGGGAIPVGSLEPLVAGGSGGAGGGGSPSGGGGGGAIQLTAVESLTLEGSLLVGGGGGGGGSGQPSWEAGGGGGSGGGLLLESPQVSLGPHAWIGLHGGGGGGGASLTVNAGPGDDGGLWFAVPAMGGSSGHPDFGAPGGDGSGPSSPENGGDNLNLGAKGGGGGGGAGCLAIRASNLPIDLEPQIGGLTTVWTGPLH